MDEDQSLGEVNATISNNDRQRHFHVPIMNNIKNDQNRFSEAHSEFDNGRLDHLDLETRLTRLSQSPVIVSTHELPAPYGCRHVSTNVIAHNMY